MLKKYTHKRIIAYLLDVIFIYVLIHLMISIKGINPLYNKYFEEYTKYSETIKTYMEEDNYDSKVINESIQESVYNLTRYSLYINIIIIICIIGYFVFFQKYNNGQTLGKKIMKLKVVNNNENPTLLKYLLRSLFNYYLLIGNIIAIFIDTTLSYTLSVNLFSILNNIVNYGYIFMGIVSFTMIHIRKDKKSIGDIIANTSVIEI